ncbi:ectonucleoside triphosphate diphosphohydrolase 2 isoform X1 [Prionailurus bengalensis]|uniref:ectonucleoside triphosphate diphosphohydrolase 2 isoform X1 n=1 Tax=Prionailurus bengalensis TaxID=37029 RepID=UPI001CA8C6A3|nr:ectonucleoside triphosphate diphosphohydrolase 2 isoform X1 [Prionailurus bengalensis]
MAGKVLSLLPPLLLAAAGLAGLLLLCVPTRDVWELPALKYGIVLDAGSSHTSMFIYKWPADKENDTGIVGQHSSCNVRGGGISSYADDPSRAGQSLVECLDQALQEVPKESHVHTPLYLGATAGMRLLNLTSPEASANVLAAVTRTLTRYPFDFRGAHILSGQDEGVFGWVTANYLLENFIKYGWVGRWFRPRKGTLGAMDLGGASTQITFETASPAEDPANEVRLRLYGQHYCVYTHSFLCYGRDQVLRRLLAGALQTHGFHPCWPRGYSTQVLLQDVYESPCTVAQRPQTLNSSTRVSLAGSSDPALCRGLILGLFNFSSCRFSRCSFNGIFQPPVAGNFMVSPGGGSGAGALWRVGPAHGETVPPLQAFSAFFYTVDFLRSVMGLPVATLQQLETAVVAVCNQTWSQLQAKAPGQRARLPDYCAGAMFVQQLLSRGYGFDERAFGGVTFQSKAGDTAVGWALGYMLNLTNLIPAEPPELRKGTDFRSWVALLLLFAAMLLAAVVLLLRQARSAGASSAI